MFQTDDREHVRARLVALAERDDRVVAAAHTGSFARGASDRWSDIDLALAIDGDVPAAAERWTAAIERELEPVHHWELPVGATLYRVFLLRSLLELDIAFVPADDFAQRGPAWKLIFGQTAGAGNAATAAADNTVGLCWHHLLHAAACVDRGRVWEAEWFLTNARLHLIELACRRLGLPSAFGRGADRLPDELKVRFDALLVRSLEPAALRAVASSTRAALIDELRATGDTLADRLEPVLAAIPLD